MNENCKNCGKEIKVQAFKGEDYCSDLCRKALGEDIPNPVTLPDPNKEWDFNEVAYGIEES